MLDKAENENDSAFVIHVQKQQPLPNICFIMLFTIFLFHLCLNYLGRTCWEDGQVNDDRHVLAARRPQLAGKLCPGVRFRAILEDGISKQGRPADRRRPSDHQETVLVADGVASTK